jgi:hypothetical protein
VVEVLGSSVVGGAPEVVVDAAADVDEVVTAGAPFGGTVLVVVGVPGTLVVGVPGTVVVGEVVDPSCAVVVLVVVVVALATVVVVGTAAGSAE